MEQTTHTNGGESLEALHSQLRECFGRVAYSHKTHEKCADIYQHRVRCIKLAQIVLSAVTTAGLFYAIVSDYQFSLPLAAIASACLLILNIYTKEYDLAELTQQHATSAGDLWDVRESYLSLLVDIHDAAVDGDYLRQKRDELQDILKNIYQAAPRTLPKAYREAQSALQLNEELTFSDEEIDMMLPESLRRMNSGRSNDRSA